jgi:glycosyltransferase involved in cell wall biosynthesis
MNKIVTIITVCYNAEFFIEETINSVISQIGIDFEYIIVDGSSKDKTINIINNYKDKIDLIICEPDNGIYDAMNKGIGKSNGDWIIFMNAGDVFNNSYVLNDIFKNKSYNDILVIYGATCYKKFDKFRIRNPRNLNTIWKGMPLCHQSMFVHKNYIKNNLFDLRYIYASDYNLLYKIYDSNRLSLQNVNLIISKISTNGFSESNSIPTYREYFKISTQHNNNNIFLKLYFNCLILERIFIINLKKVLKLN